MDTTSHALFSCARSKACWKDTDLYHYIGRIQGHDSREICFWLMHELGRHKFERMAICTWAIWKEITSFLHSEGGRTNSSDIGWSLDFLGDYQNLKKREMQISEATIIASPTRCNLLLRDLSGWMWMHLLTHD